MENKYQEALYVVNERFDYMNEELHPNKHYQKPQFSLDTLQELIDNYETSLRLCVMETREKVILEKALDMACEELEDFSADFTSQKQSKEEWKEYLLKESEAENGK